MSRLNSQMHAQLNSEVLNALFEKNIYTNLNFVEADAKHLSQVTNLPYKDILDIRKHLINKYSAVEHNGTNYYKEFVKQSTILPTYIKNLDVILQGGLLTGNVYEICGLPASGKSQLCLTLAKNTVENSHSNVFYIDTKRDFSARKLKSVLTAKTIEESLIENILSKILVKQVNTVYDLFNTLYEIQNWFRTKRIKSRLIIIDSLPSTFYPVSDLAKNCSLMNSLINIIHVLAKEYHTVVVGTNITTTWYENFEQVKKIGLGKYWFDVPNTRLGIKNENSNCTINIVNSNRLLVGLECTVKITDAGVI